MMDSLLYSGGMAGMMNTIWLIICAMIFGGAMQSTGLLKKIAEPILKYAKSTGNLIATTAGLSLIHISEPTRPERIA